MNIIFRTLALALVFSPLPAMAFLNAKNMEDAKSKAGKDGIVIVTYAEGWDKYSKKAAERMLAAAPVRKALGRAVVLEYGVPNVTSEKEQEEIKARFGKTDIKFPNSYPAFIFYNKEGYRLADVCIAFDEIKKTKEVAKRIKEVLDASEKQQELLAQAEKASGVEKARLLGQASAISGLNKPENVAKRIQDADPTDESGMHQFVTLNLFDKAIGTAKTPDWQATLAEMKRLMEHPMLTTDHQQQLCCICIGLLHRKGGPEHRAELKEMIDKLEQLNPESVLGKSAVDARRLWLKDEAK